MKACVLIAAPRERMDALAARLENFVILRTSDQARAELLVRIGCFQAVVVTEGFLPGLDEVIESPIITVGLQGGLDDLPARVEAVIQASREVDHRSSYDLAALSTLPYATYLELVRFRATRRYLLGLMRRHRGSVTEASMAAGIARETLHRQLRRHDVDADAFRDTDPP